MILQTNVDFAKRIFMDRVGNEYRYAETWNPHNLKQGCDCSALVADVLSACLLGTAMKWGREAEGATTESYRYNIPVGGVGPFGTIRAGSAAAIPADAVVKIALRHGPGGGKNSHMWCEVDGVRMESAGTKGCVTGPQALSVFDSYANDWFYLPRQTFVPVKGLDYAGGRPGGAAIRAAGYKFVVRYLSDGGASLPGKILTPAEADDLRAHGIDIVSNWETTANWMLGGRQAGRDAATKALARVLACGGRRDRPIYFSADWDATPGEQVMIDDCLKGCADIIGAANVGIYGGFWPVSRALTNNTARWAWQTHAWSGTNFDNRAQLEQKIGFVTVGGVECDENFALASDYGQWSYTGKDEDFLSALTDVEQRELLDNSRQNAVYLRESLSPLRHVGEGKIDTSAGFGRRADGGVHLVSEMELAKTGWAPSIALLNEVAEADLAKFPDRKDDAALAAHLLKKVVPATASFKLPDFGALITDPVGAVTDTVTDAITSIPVAGPIVGPIITPVVEAVADAIPLPDVFHPDTKEDNSMTEPVAAVTADAGFDFDEVRAQVLGVTRTVLKVLALAKAIEGSLPENIVGTLNTLVKVLTFVEGILD